MEKPSIADVRGATGISQSYASMILSGARHPSRPLAIRIFRVTGWKHPLITGLSDAQIDALETIEPWQRQPRPTPTEEAA